MIELSPQQVSLIDVLRLLRQRRKQDPQAQLFVQEQLKVANVVVTQVIVLMFPLYCLGVLLALYAACSRVHYRSTTEAIREQEHHAIHCAYIDWCR